VLFEAREIVIIKQNPFVGTEFATRVGGENIKKVQGGG